jgi:hypothetical protein
MTGFASSLRATLAAVLLAAGGCAGMMNTPTEQSIAGLSPSGNVTITEDFVTGLGGGNGTLFFQGQSYPFKVLGSVAGPAAESKRSAPRARSTSSPASPILQGDARKAPAPPVSAARAAAICGCRTVPV